MRGYIFKDIGKDSKQTYSVMTFFAMGLENTSLFVFFRGVILLCAVFHAGVESSALSRSTYFTTLTNKRLKGFVVKRFKSTSQIWCSQSCLKNAWCTSTNFKPAPQTSKSDGKGTCELNKHDVIKENAHLQFEAEVIFSTLIKVNNCNVLIVFNVFSDTKFNHLQVSHQFVYF